MKKQRRYSNLILKHAVTYCWNKANRTLEIESWDALINITMKWDEGDRRFVKNKTGKILEQIIAIEPGALLEAISLIRPDLEISYKK